MDIVKSEERLRSVLVNDKQISNIENVLKSDLICVMQNYMDIISADVCLNIETTRDGWHEIRIFARSKRMKNLSALISEN